MNSPIRRNYLSIKVVITALSLLVGLVMVLIAVNKTFALETNSKQGDHLITIHDRGTEKVILTNASTIGEALAEAGIELDAKDAVEPARTEQLVASNYEVNIYRARPVTVVDGSTKIQVITPYQTAGQIASSAGIDLYPEDRTIITRSDNIVSDGPGLVLTIERATEINIKLYGKSVAARTQAETVGDLLIEKGIVLGINDKVSPSSEARIVSGILVDIWREGKQTITVSEAVDFDVKTIQDGDRAIGYRQITTTGIKGSREATYEIIIKNGKEVNRKEIASVATKQPKDQVEIIGTKQNGTYTTPSENEIITWNYLINQGFSREQTAGIMGNLMQEHRFNTDGDGLAQWNGSRKARLMSLPSPYSIYTQLAFLMSELNGSYSFVHNQIKSTNSIDTAVIIFQNKFEKCGICSEGKRVEYAHNIYVSH